ncbi:hypothetical protein ACIRPH_00155 [Nocardiopsis sp. NPDC101807]|uniref:hypothetical protein n=1 Tax=Nocardiopsis sp. NPDC101807 TaxID=3364339 RepID=UPI0038234344
MKRMCAAATLSVALLGALALTTPAHAANGVVTVAGQEYHNPISCYTLPSRGPHIVDNQTDQPVYLFQSRGCMDQRGSVAPGQKFQPNYEVASFYFEK